MELFGSSVGMWLDKGGKELIQFHLLSIQHKYVASLKLPMREPYSTPSFHRDVPESPFLLYNQLTLKTRELVKLLLTQKENKYLNLTTTHQIWINKKVPFNH